MFFLGHNFIIKIVKDLCRTDTCYCNPQKYMTALVTQTMSKTILQLNL